MPTRNGTLSRPAAANATPPCPVSLPIASTAGACTASTRAVTNATKRERRRLPDITMFNLTDRGGRGKVAASFRVKGSFVNCLACASDRSQDCGARADVFEHLVVGGG